MRAATMSGEGVLITGVYGTGKTSVVEEMAGIMEAAGLNYGAIDLDWLRWFDADIDEARYQKIFLANVTSITTAYLDVGVERFALAGAIADQTALAALREARALPRACGAADTAVGRDRRAARQRSHGRTRR